MASSTKGKAVLYETDSDTQSISDFLNIEKKLTEIVLPENQNEIKESYYDPVSDRIVLVTSKDTKLWNPFVKDLLVIVE